MSRAAFIGGVMKSLGVETGLKLLNQQYVLYRDLEENEDARLVALGESANRAIQRVHSPIIPNRIQDNLYNMAQVEAEKEVAFLHEIFGKEITFDPFSDDFYNELIESINLALNLSTVYKRNKDRILAEETQISIAQLFPSYFGTVWTRHVNEIKQEIIDRFTESEQNKTFVQITDEVMEKWIPKLLDAAIKNMFNSKDFKNSPETGRAYKELIKVYEEFGASDSDFAKEIRAIYHLDEISQFLAKELTDKSKKPNISRTAVGRETFARNVYSDGGLSYEALENFTFNSLKSSLEKKGIKVETFRIGGKEFKSDNAVSFNIDPSPIQDMLNTTDPISRKRNIDAANALGERLEKFKDGFLVYSNAKNYSLTKDFKTRGFSSGQDLSLQAFSDVLRETPQPEPDLFLGALSSTIHGAYADDKETKARLTQIIATNIAYLLFDDVKLIGVPKDSGRTLHLFSLDGIYIPLSVLIYKLANAVEKGLLDQARNSKMVRAYIRYNGEAKNILYPRDKMKKGVPSGWPQSSKERWEHQREVALTNIRIGAYFLSNIEEIISAIK